MTNPEVHSAGRKDGDPREQWERAVAFTKRALRFWPTLVTVLSLGAIACVAFLMLRQPEYRSETLILYTDGIRPTDAAGEPSRIGPRDAAVRLREMLMSRPRLERIIDEYGLYPEVRQQYGRVDAVEELRDHVDFRAPGGDTFSIGFKGDSPEQAKAVTEELAQSLIADEARLRRDQARQHREFLRAERERTERALKQAEREVAQFLADHPELAADAMLLMPGMPSTGAAIRAAAAEPPSGSAPAATRWHTVTVGGGEAEPSSGAPAPPSAALLDRRREIAAAKARAESDLAAAQAALADKSARFTALHPDVRALSARVARERARVEAATAALASLEQPQAAPTAGPARSARVVRRVRVRAPAASDANAKDGDAKRGKQELVELETEWARLTRTAAEARAKNDQVEAGLFKAELSSKSERDGTGANMVVLDPAFLPVRPMPPGELTIGGIFGVISLLLGVGLVAGRAAIDDRVQQAKDVKRYGRLLVEVPPLPKH